VLRALRVCALCTLLLFTLAAPAFAADGDTAPLEPTHRPMPPPEKPIYTTDYLFAVTRSVTSSTLVPAARVPLFLFTVPIDLAFLPIEAIAGFPRRIAAWRCSWCARSW
jgi:hypothetical protein